jgi:putative ABC transport system permease protein
MKIRIDRLCQDIQYGLRLLRTNPGYSAVVVLTLALGIGATSAMFSLVYAAVLRPLPFSGVQRLVFISTGKVQTGLFNSGVSDRELKEWEPQLHRVLEEFATVSGNRHSTWSFASEAAQVADRDVSANFFSMLGVHPFAGRAFSSEDTVQGHGDVVLLSYDFWQRHFGGDFRALGQPMRKKGGAYAAYTIVGILPPAFEFDETTDVWTLEQPLPAVLTDLRTIRRFRVVGRLIPGVRLWQARAAMETLAAQEAQAYPASDGGWGIKVVPLRDYFQANRHTALILLWAAASCLLLIACANAANLLLARSRTRGSEIALRLALGSSRGRLMAQLLTESALLAALGGGLGWGTAAWVLKLLRFWGSFLLPAATLEDVTRLRPDALEPAVVSFTLLACISALLAFSLAPALSATRLGLHQTMQSSSGRRNTRRFGTSQLLVTAEIAIVMVLLMSSGLLVRSFMALMAVDPGFQAGNRLTFDVELPPLPDPRPLTSEQNRRRWQHQTLWFEELESRLQSVPGVLAVGASDAFPLTEDAEGGWGVKIDNKQLPASTSMAHVSPGYFNAVGAPIVEGSNFSQATYSIPNAKALIVNQTMARLLFPGGDAIGRRVNAPRCHVVSSSDAQPADCLIVGIAKDTRFNLDAPPPPTFYYSLHQDAGDRVTYVIRASQNPVALVPAVRTVVSNMPPMYSSSKAYIFQLQTLDHLVAQSVAAPRFRSWLVSLFAGLALVLAAVGIYGVQAHAVSQRTHEIGIRMALGATPPALFTQILCGAAGWALLGVTVGLGTGFAATRMISGLLFGVNRWDPMTLVVSPLVLLGVALAAAYLPARRAMYVDPLVALRHE